MSEAYRAWINQPSTAQELHRYHGERVLVVGDTMYFARNTDRISMVLVPQAISLDWPSHLQ